MQPSHHPTTHFLLWSRKVESPSCSTWQIKQHISHSNYQERRHHRSRISHIRQRLELGEAQCFRQDVDGVLWFKDRLVVPKDLELHRKIMDEAHCSRYSIHPWTNKMYQDVKKSFWWTRIKRETARYLAECDTCQRVKIDHLSPTGNLQPSSVPEWKWKDICMEFIVGLPRTTRGHDSMWVIAHFIPVGTRYRVR
jgi:hypothetical protein